VFRGVIQTCRLFTEQEYSISISKLLVLSNFGIWVHLPTHSINPRTLPHPDLKVLKAALMKSKSSGMLHLAECLSIADFSEERAASIFRDSQYQNYRIS